MKSKLLLIWLLCWVIWPQLAGAQAYQPKKDYAFLSSKRIFHFVSDMQPLQAGELKDLPPPQRVVVVKPAAAHPIEVAQSVRAYDDGRFADAAAAVTQLAALRPADPQVLNCYARALYRQEGTRDRSYPVYQRLIALLDSYGQEGPAVVSVYLPFLEAYFKLATLQLDQAQWAAASYNLSRAAAALQSTPDAAGGNPVLREQMLQYQTECFSHMGQPQLCRYFGQRTLQAYPNNQYVRSYLAALPKSGAQAPAAPRR